MVVHIVMFTFKEQEKSQNMAQAKMMLQALPIKIEGLLNMEVGIDFSRTDRAMDMVLTSSFASKKDLEVYATHPAHLEVVEFIKSVTSLSRVVDYEK